MLCVSSMFSWPVIVVEKVCFLMGCTAPIIGVDVKLGIKYHRSL